MHHQSAYQAELANSPAQSIIQQADEAQAMQARLHELEQMAQELLL